MRYCHCRKGYFLRSKSDCRVLAPLPFSRVEVFKEKVINGCSSVWRAYRIPMIVDSYWEPCVPRCLAACPHSGGRLKLRFPDLFLAMGEGGPGAQRLHKPRARQPAKPEALQTHRPSRCRTPPRQLARQPARPPALPVRPPFTRPPARPPPRELPASSP